MFLLSCGTDIYGSKQNIRLEFPSSPTMTELINAVESQYDVMARATRPAGYPDVPFKVQTFQVYDDVLLRWVDLYSSSQLANGSQLFCFQPESIWHSDAQGIIPDAKESVTWTTPTGSARRARVATDAGVAPALSEKLRSVFYDVDGSNKGYVVFSDLRAAFAKAEIEFTHATVGDLFNSADSNRSGHVTYDEWVRFAIKYPHIVDALFFRSRDMNGPAGGGSYSYTGYVEPTSAQRARTTELRDYYTTSWQGSAPRQRALDDYEAAKSAADSARMQKELAESEERSAWDRLYYNPSSPSRV